MRVDGDTPTRTYDPTRLSRSDSTDPTGDKLMAKIVACGRGDDPMYLICYIATNNTIVVAHRCDNAQDITNFMNANRGNKVEYFVLSATIYPEKR